MDKLVAIAGPSCGGKTTLRNALVEGWPESFVSVVTTTTRPLRKGEQKGVDYNFVSIEEFEGARAQGKLIEAVQNGDHWYGVSVASLEGALEKDLNGVVVVTPEGLSALGDWCEAEGVALTTVFATAPLKVLYQRLRDRRMVSGEDDFEERRERLAEQAIGWRERWHYDIQAMNG